MITFHKRFKEIWSLQLIYSHWKPKCHQATSVSNMSALRDVCTKTIWPFCLLDWREQWKIVHMKHQSWNCSLQTPMRPFQSQQAVEYSQLDLLKHASSLTLGPKMTSDRYNGILGMVKRNKYHVESLELSSYVTRFSLSIIKTCNWVGKSTFHPSLSISSCYSSVTKITCCSVSPFPFSWRQNGKEVMKL